MKIKGAQLVGGMAVALLLGAWATAAWAQAPVIASFGKNGVLVCTNLLPGTMAVVEWAPSVDGPWATNWEGLTAITPDASGSIQVRVPMFYRVRGTPPIPPGMVLVPAGVLSMGDSLNDEPQLLEHPVHSVRVAPFFMDRTEVTWALWTEVRLWAMDHGYGIALGAGKADNHPVYTVNWYDVVKWCNARSEREGRVPAYYTDAARTVVYRMGQTNLQNNWVRWDAGYRLPTEAEWEYAARGGLSDERFPWGNVIDHTRANYLSVWSNGRPAYTYDASSAEGYHPAYDNDPRPYTSPAGSFAPNGYGLCDMADNVAEWCWDWWGPYATDAQADPRGPVSGSSRALRGGSWYGNAVGCRVAYRADSGPDFRGYFLGFRSVLPLGQP